MILRGFEHLIFVSLDPNIFSTVALRIRYPTELCMHLIWECVGLVSNCRDWTSTSPVQMPDFTLWDQFTHVSLSTGKQQTHGMLPSLLLSGVC